MRYTVGVHVFVCMSFACVLSGAFVWCCLCICVRDSAEGVPMWLCERNWLLWHCIIVISAPSSVLWRAEPAGQRSVKLNKWLCFLLRRAASHLLARASFEIWVASDKPSVKERGMAREWVEEEEERAWQRNHWGTVPGVVGTTKTV